MSMRAWPIKIGQASRSWFEQRMTSEPGNERLASELADALWGADLVVDNVWIDDAVPPHAKLMGDTPWEFVGKPDL